MERTDENIALAIEKLSMFTDCKGFPSNEAALDLTAEIVCAIVRNQPCWEIIEPRIIKHPDLPEVNQEEWLAKRNLKPTDTDLDYLFRKLWEMSEGKFPYPATIRRVYWKIMGAPADGKDVFVLDEE